MVTKRSLQSAEERIVRLESESGTLRQEVQTWVDKLKESKQYDSRKSKEQYSKKVRGLVVMLHFFKYVNSLSLKRNGHGESHHEYEYFFIFFGS